MTIREAIELVDRMKPSQYDDLQKVQWLSDLDRRAYREVILTHEYSGTLPEEPTYTESTDTDTDLLITGPHARDIYLYHLEAMIDRENGELAKYNASGTFFNNAYAAWAGEYNRKNMPVYRGGHFKF